MPPLAAAYNATRAEMQLNQRAQAGMPLPLPVVKPPSVVEVLAEMSRQSSPPPPPQTPEQQRANWEFLRSGAGLPVPGGHMLPATMSSTEKDPLSSIPWADRGVLTSAVQQWVSPTPAAPVVEELPTYRPPEGVDGPVKHIGILALSTSAVQAETSGGGGAPSQTSTTPAGCRSVRSPDPLYIVKTSSWPWTVRDHWGLQQKVAWLEAIMHPYLVFPYWRSRLGEATRLSAAEARRSSRRPSSRDGRPGQGPQLTR